MFGLAIMTADFYASVDMKLDICLRTFIAALNYTSN